MAGYQLTDTDDSSSLLTYPTHDVLVRLQKMADGAWEPTESMETKTFTDFVETFVNASVQQKKLLSRVIEYLHNANEYNSLYRSTHMGMVSDDEFEKESERFEITHENDIDEDSLRRQIKFLRVELPWALSTSEISDILRAEPARVNAICSTIDGVEEDH